MDKAISYTLKSKDIPLIDFRYVRELSTIRNRLIRTSNITIDKVYTENLRLYPKALKYSEDTQALSNSLMQWLKSRKAPSGRVYIDKIFEAIGGDLTDPLRYIQATRGMSLNDAYWVDDSTGSIEWDECSLYTHPFNEVISRLAFTGHADISSLQGHLSSPEFTTGGALRKCWINHADGIYLRKAEDPQFVPKDGRSQVSMEYYACQVAQELEFRYAPYSLKNYVHSNGKSEVVCECPLFTSEDIGYVNAVDFLKNKGIQMSYQDMSNPKTHIKIAEAYGYDAYSDMMVFDALILNADRHVGNFGYLVDNNTGEYIEPAPLFDNGFSLLVGAAQIELENPEKLLSSDSCRYGRYLAFDDQLSLFLEERHIPAIERLAQFEFTQPEGVYGVSDSTLEVLNYAVRYRSRRALEIWRDIQKSPGDSLEEADRSDDPFA